MKIHGAMKAVGLRELKNRLSERQAIAGLELLSLDDRIRAAGRQLGIGVQPAHV